MGLANTLNYPKSRYKLKSITGFKIYIYFREHALGNSEAVIPKIIRENKHVINFPEPTTNVCFTVPRGICISMLRKILIGSRLR